METTNTLPTPPRTGPNRRRRIASAASVGLLAGLIAVGAGGVAMAQGDTPPEPAITESAEVTDADSDGAEDINTEPGADVVVRVEVDSADSNVELMDIELSPEDEAVFDRFDACLAEKGVSDATEDEWETRWENGTDEQRDALDAEVTAIFEQCESILDDLSEGGAVFEGDIEIGEWDDDYELSPEDGAVFDVWEIEGCGDEFEDDDVDAEDDDNSEETPGS